MSFEKLVELYNHYYHHDIEYCHHPEKFFWYLLAVNSLPLYLGLWKPLICFLSPLFCFF